MRTYRFACGCEIPVDESLPRVHDLPSLIYPDDISGLRLDCPLTFELLSMGNTKGVFQLESPLGRQYTKKLRPGVPDPQEGIEHLAALGAILRPGCLKAKDEDGISMTDRYCRRKNGEEPVSYYHPALESILKPTYGVLVYQEQSMAIAVALAGFSPQEADDLRKAISKKKTDAMAKVRTKFLEKAGALGIVTPEQAAEIFGWIQKSARYQFNKSHSISYGLIGYHTAHAKAHFPLHFYTSFLYYAKEKQDPLLEIRQLVNDARGAGIEVLPPRFVDLKCNFSTDGVVITFGLADAKGIGNKHVLAMRENARITQERLRTPRLEWSWYDFLVYFSPSCPSNVVRRMIEVGATRNYGMDRQRMLYEYDIYHNLTDREQHTIASDLSLPETKGTLEGALEALLQLPKGVANKNRRKIVEDALKKLRKPNQTVVDTPAWVAKVEEECLGIPITHTRVEGKSALRANTTCKEFRDGKGRDCVVIAAEIQECREHRIQNGKNIGKTMAFLVVSDGTGSLDDICVFSDAWDEYNYLLVPGDTVELKGRRDPKRGSLIVDEVWKAT